MPDEQNTFDAGGKNRGRIPVSNESKVYVIDPKKTSNLRTIMEKTLKPAPETPGSDGGRSRKEPDGNGYVRPASAQFVILSYLLGPLAIFTTRVGRRSRLWAALAGVSAVLVLSLVFGWSHILSKFGEKGFVILPLMLVTSISMLVGFTVWARAVYLLGRHRPLLARNLPEPLRKPGLIGMLGFLVPGLGLLVTGHHRRASCAVWLSGLLALSLFVLTRAAWLWSWNRGAGSEAIQGTTLEHLFLGMGIAGLIGALVWIVQALDGGRLAERRFVQKRRPSGGGAAFALLAALVLFAFLFQPASVAETLDRFAVSAGYEGFRVLPLHAELAAMRLDPSRPAFAVKAAELYEDIGRHEDAQILRGDLAKRLRPCIGALRRHGLLDPYTDAGAVDGVEADTQEHAEAVAEEPAGDEASVGPWERIRSEYGLFALPQE
jgi:hypothetical protein